MYVVITILLIILGQHLVKNQHYENIKFVGMKAMEKRISGKSKTNMLEREGKQ